MPADRTASAAENSLLGRLLGRVALIETHELASVVVAFLLFFFVLGGYFSVRPVRETVGTVLGGARVADLYIATWIASLALIPIYGAIVARLRRRVFLPLIYGLVSLSLVAVGAALRADENNIAVGTFFYVYISVLSLFLTSVFWSFLLELFDSNQAKRLFGVIAAGGTAGALAGPAVTFVTVKYIGNHGVLWIAAAMFALAVVCQRALLRIWERQKTLPVDASAQNTNEDSAPAPRADKAIGGNPFAGFKIVLTSPYLLAVALFVMLLAQANTFLYFEQLRLVKETFASGEERTRVFALLDTIVQSLTIVCQVFLTGRIASRLGIVVLLTVVPVAMVFGFLTLAAAGTFTVLAIVFVLRRVGEYAFIRPGREILFSRLGSETKYKAKSLIDVPIYRASDALSAQASKALDAGGLPPAVVALLGAALAVVWAVNGWWLGRRHDRAPN